MDEILEFRKVNAHVILLVNFPMKISLPCKNYTTSAAIILIYTYQKDYFEVLLKCNFILSSKNHLIGVAQKTQ